MQGTVLPSLLFSCCCSLLPMLLRSFTDGWTRTGKEFFTNERTKVPQEYQSRATTVKTDDSRVSVGGKTALPHAASVEVKEHRDKNGRGEECWRRRAGNQRLELRKLEDDYDLLLKKEQDQEKKTTRISGKKKKPSSRR